MPGLRVLGSLGLPVMGLQWLLQPCYSISNFCSLPGEEGPYHTVLYPQEASLCPPVTLLVWTQINHLGGMSKSPARAGLFNAIAHLLAQRQTWMGPEYSPAELAPMSPLSARGVSWTCPGGIRVRVTTVHRSNVTLSSATALVGSLWN